jgi:hypothetical protein
MRVLACTLIAAALGGCFLKVPFWESKPWQGPLIEGNRYAAVVERCEMGPRGISDVIYCDRAFVDHNGKKVNVAQLKDSIDAFLPKVAPLIPWVKVDHGDKLSPRAPQRGRIPYRLHILTISPLIMLAVPDKDPRRSYCSGHIFERGCMPTAKLDLEPYWWKLTPNVQFGTFWFSPELDVKMVPLPEGRAQHVIAAGNSNIELNRQGETWLVSRPSRK